MSLFEPERTEISDKNSLEIFEDNNFVLEVNNKKLQIDAETSKSDEKIIFIETDSYIASISNRSGGSFNEFKLKNYLGGFNSDEQYNSQSFVSLISSTNDGCAPCLILNNSVTGNSIIFDDYFNSSYKDGDTIYLSNNDTYSLDFHFEHDDGYNISKTMNFNGDSYIFNQQVEFKSLVFNYSDIIQLAWTEGLLPTELSEMEDVRNSGVVINQVGEIEDFNHTDDSEIFETMLRGDTDWIALKTKYFLTAIIPEVRGVFGSYSYKNIIFNNREITPKYSMYLGFKIKKILQLNNDIYFGPLDYNILSQYGIGLENSLNLGWQFIRPFSKLVLKLLEFLHRFINNYGIVLIIFAILIRVITGPLTKKSALSSQKMQKIQPEIKKVQEKYKNDPQKRNQATMALYKKHGVNPLGGCLPILIQMPLLFSLFTVFRTTIEFRGAEFFWWIKDLSQPDSIFQLPFSLPLYGDSVCILPLFMGITMFLQQRTSMATMDKTQKMPMYFMSVFFFLLFNQFPSGLNLYYSVSNILNIIQQRSLRKNVTNKKTA